MARRRTRPREWPSLSKPSGQTTGTADDAAEVARETIEGADKPESPHCACGAALAEEDERAAGVCVNCVFLWPDGTLHHEPPSAADETTHIEQVAAEAEAFAGQASPPVNVPLPFPSAPVEPFDFHGCSLDIFQKNREVEARKRTYDDLNERTKDAKKQWEAAASALGLVIAEYDRKEREAEDAERRQEQQRAAFYDDLGEKFEADAAKAAQPDLPTEAPTAEERVPDLASTTPLTDALPACPCGAALALDTEKAAGRCEDCATKPE